MTPWITPHLTGLATNSQLLNQGVQCFEHVSKAEHGCVGGEGGQQAFCLVAKWSICLVAKQAVEFQQVLAS